MSLPCFLCHRHDSRTDCGGLFCQDCQELPEEQKRDALARALEQDEERTAA